MPAAEEFKLKLDEWCNRFNEQDVHSIGTQIANMLWRSAFYRSLNQSRRFLPEGKDGRKLANGPLHELIDDGYFVLNSIAIRRLLDKDNVQGPRGVNSLYGLIKDIRSHAHLITRKNVLKSRDLEYGYEPVRRHAFAEARAGGNPAFFVSPHGWLKAEYWHKTMDKLCGVNENNRNSVDAIEPAKLDKLLHDLEQCGTNVKVWVDKFVAHSASHDSRHGLPAEHQSLSLARLWLAERVVVRAANFISLYIVLGTNVPGVPIPQFDQFADLNHPFAHPSAISAMRKEWEQHCREINSCEHWYWDHPLADQLDTWTDQT